MVRNEKIWSFACLVCLLTGCTGCFQAHPADRTTAARFAPRDLFRMHCSSCHGDGTGNGHVAPTLKVRPRNLKHKDWQRSVSDAHIRKVIRDGGAAVKLNEDMPAFGEKLSDKEIESLGVYIRSLGR